ncbi:PEP-CTERM sorting domain-containing protein [Corallincola luteus]|uniref:PEP-CTERM sorting domain-containing protein n=1 Tax=Corallincola luteus TaxID=1775177 RepID=A0ABY2AI80_9GAMM|nr:PEP-CTERM sorting domain-containing protein [Corallincola luteus]TCI02393.1 PEP-CTERM sorting domain-containing protein [Corallincola luteus]
MKLKHLALGALLSVSTASYAAPFTNGGFESGDLSPWVNVSSPEWYVTDTESHSGSYSATDVGNFQLKQTFDAVATENVSEVSFWLKQPEAAISWVGLFYSDGSSVGDIVNLTTSDWEFFDITSWLVAGKELTGFGLYGYSGAGPDEDRTYLDDVTISYSAEVPAPGILALFALSILGFAAARRK